MELKRRIDALAGLGNYIGKLHKNSGLQSIDNHIEQIFNKTKAKNGWFTLENIQFALQEWAEALSKENLEFWMSKYNFPNSGSEQIKTIAIIMAGNVPLVGFHDFISVLITGNRVVAKLASNDNVLIPFLADKLISLEEGFKDRITFTEGNLPGFDAVIATGSNNTSRYFDYYFGKYPNIIRKNRNSVAVLTGDESEEELQLLADDIFRYFGLGCRNVSKLYIPKTYDFENFFKGMYRWNSIINNHKYINNYDYNKAVYLMDELPLLDNGFLLLKEDPNFSSPIAVVFYERYDSLLELEHILKDSQDKIQCIVSKNGLCNGLAFGKTQSPELLDYADGVDTVKFLLELSN